MKKYTKPVMMITVLDRPHTFDVTVSGENDTWGDGGDSDSDASDAIEQSDD